MSLVRCDGQTVRPRALTALRVGAAAALLVAAGVVVAWLLGVGIALASRSGRSIGR